MNKTKQGFPFIINRRLCKKCGICAAFCPVEVYTINSKKEPEVTYPDKCIQCNLCFYRCPDFAIQLEVNS